MSTLTGEYTLVDLKAMHDPKGNVAKVVDVLSEVNDVMADAVWMEANDLTSHVVTRAFSEGAGEAGIVNQEVAYETDVVTQIREPLEIFESYSRIDERLIKRATDAEMFRAQQNAMRLRGMAKSWAGRVFYGNETPSAENVRGLMVRYNDLDLANVHGAGGSGSDLASIWVIQWGGDGAYLVYPRGGKGFIDEEDLGQQLIGSSTGAYTALVSHYMINWGLAVADDRAVQRICNIETSGSSNIFDEDDLITALNLLPDPGNIGRTRIYVNRTIKTQMDIALKDKSNVNFSVSEGLGGAPVLNFRGVPVKIVDQLATDEVAVTS